MSTTKNLGNSLGLEDKVALVTGAGSGIGRATAQRLAAAGAIVIATDLSVEAAEETAESLSDGKALSSKMDVTDEKNVEQTINQVAEQWGGLDILVNSAGSAGPPGGPLEITSESFEQVMRVNVSGMFNTCKYALPHLIARCGAIVNIASIAGRTGSGPPTIGPLVAYTASKHAVIGLTRSIAVRHGIDGVRANAVNPGNVVSGMTSPLMQSSRYTEGVIEATPLGRWGQPGDIAATIAFLASDAADFITGETLTIDGGYMQTQGKVYTEYES